MLLVFFYSFVRLLRGVLMRNRLCATAVSFYMLLAAQSASACRTVTELQLEDIKFASTVVVGRITNYEIVLDQAAREHRERILANPDLNPEYKKGLLNQKSWLSDYARFNVLVDEVLAGRAPEVITVTWNNSTFGEPRQMDDGPFLIALRDPRSKSPPLRGPSATIVEPREQALTVLQAPCAGAFIFHAFSSDARKLREILSGTAR